MNDKLNVETYKARFLQKMADHNITPTIALAEYEGIADEEPWKDVPPTPEADAEDVMSCWVD